MKFEFQETTRYARSVVFATHRDQLEAIVKYLPDIENVELRSRTVQAGGREQQVHWWTGSPSALPVFIRPLVPPGLLQWKQTTDWDAHTHCATWVIEVPGLGQAMASNGSNKYSESGASCRIDIEGDFSFHPDRVPQLSSIPAAAVPIVEKAVVGLILPMIQRTGSAVTKFLDEQKKS